MILRMLLTRMVMKIKNVTNNTIINLFPLINRHIYKHFFFIKLHDDIDTIT